MAWAAVPSPMSQLILQPNCLFTYVTGTSLTSSGELPVVWLLTLVLRRVISFKL